MEIKARSIDGAVYSEAECLVILDKDLPCAIGKALIEHIEYIKIHVSEHHKVYTKELKEQQSEIRRLRQDKEDLLTQLKEMRDANKKDSATLKKWLEAFTKPSVKDYSGIISVGYMESDDVLTINGKPLSEEIEQDIKDHGQFLSVRYWVTKEAKTKEQLSQDTINDFFGISRAEFYQHYSEYTGYLWTDDSLTVGGHDLLKELSTHKGLYLYMEIDYYKFPHPNLH